MTEETRKDIGEGGKEGRRERWSVSVEVDSSKEQTVERGRERDVLKAIREVHPVKG